MKRSRGSSSGSSSSNSADSNSPGVSADPSVRAGAARAAARPKSLVPPWRRSAASRSAAASGTEPSCAQPTVAQAPAGTQGPTSEEPPAALAQAPSSEEKAVGPASREDSYEYYSYSEEEGQSVKEESVKEEPAAAVAGPPTPLAAPQPPTPPAPAPQEEVLDELLNALVNGDSERALLLAQTASLATVVHLDSLGQTALHYAVRSRSVLLCDQLLQRAPQLSLQRTKPTTRPASWNPLHVVSDMPGPERPDIVTICLRLVEAMKSVDPDSLNAKTAKGSTALHMATSKGHTGILRALLQGGADPNVVDNVGKTARDRAIRCNAACDQLLASFGGQIAGPPVRPRPGQKPYWRK